ncbi:MAG: TolC family protein [Nitrospiria bacterium]
MGATALLTGCQTYHPQPLTSASVTQELTPALLSALRVQSRQLNHPILKPVELDFDHGLSPDGAAVLTVLLNPGLRIARDQRGLADAQLLQAGLLPNPQLSTHLDQPAFGSTSGTVTGYGIGLSWDLQNLVTRAARLQAARHFTSAVQLDVAWQEWQAAQAARTAVYHLTALESQTNLSASLDRRLKENLDLVRHAVEAGQMTELNLAAAETASNQAHSNWIAYQKQADQQRLELNRLLGVPFETRITLQSGIALPLRLDPPSASQLLEDVEDRRLDLVALRRGYASQEAVVRAAVLAQFPRINFGVNRASDTANVGTTGFGATLDLPVFDRNQGVIALEQATRQKLFDEYVNRVFEARAEISRLLTDIHYLNEQISTAQAAEPGLDRLVQTYRLAVNAGQADVISYYTAWNNFTEKQIEVLALQQNLMETLIALELASGLYHLNSDAANQKEK